MDYIHWNPSLEIFSIWGVTIRWYGLLWVVGLLGSSIIVNKINKYQKEKLLVEQLFYFCFVGVWPVHVLVIVFSMMHLNG